MVDTLFFDLDGTLLDSNKTISDRCLEIMRRCHQKGFHFGIATGRAFGSIQPLLERYALHTIFEVVVANSGADIFTLSDMKQIQLGHVSYKAIQEIGSRFCGYPDIVIAFHNPGYLYTTKITPYLRKVRIHNNERACKLLSHGMKYVEPARVMLEFHDQDTLEYILSNPIPGLKGYHSEPQIYEFLNESVSKSNGIAYYMNLNKKTLANVMCFGDGDNDVEMLMRSKLGVAMKNSTAGAIQAADIHWAFTNDEEGVYQFLNQLIIESDS